MTVYILTVVMFLTGGLVVTHSVQTLPCVAVTQQQHA